MIDPLVRASVAVKQALEDERRFQDWYAGHRAGIYQRHGFLLDQNPDAPEHKYDFRAAFAAGATPDPQTGHWPSTFKADDHPNRFVYDADANTVEDTKYGERMWPAMPAAPTF